jgi:uncharacterized protein YycO
VTKVERYGPGEGASDFTPGDFILTHRHTPIAQLISVGEKWRFRGTDSAYSHWSHCALVAGGDGDLVEAESTGVRRSPIARYKADEYHLVRLGPEFTTGRRQRAVAYAEAQVGKAFGYFALAGAALFLVTGLPFQLMRQDHQICSGLVVRALQHGGLLADLDPSLTLPADLARTFGVRAGQL